VHFVAAGSIHIDEATTNQCSKLSSGSRLAENNRNQTQN